MQKGFTLIEILIVLVIIGILSLVSIPKYIDFLHQAEEIRTIAELQSIYNAVYSYKALYGIMPKKLSDVIYIPSLDSRYEYNSRGDILV